MEKVDHPHAPKQRFVQDISYFIEKTPVAPPVEVLPIDEEFQKAKAIYNSRRPLIRPDDRRQLNNQVSAGTKMKFNPPPRGVLSVQSLARFRHQGTECESDDSEDEDAMHDMHATVKLHATELPTMNDSESDSAESDSDNTDGAHEDDEEVVQEGKVSVEPEVVNAARVSRSLEPQAPLTDLEAFLRMQNFSQHAESLVDGFASQAIMNLDQLLTLPSPRFSTIIDSLGMSASDELTLLHAMRSCQPDKDTSGNAEAHEPTELREIFPELQEIHDELEQELDAFQRELEAGHEPIKIWHSQLVPLLSPKRDRCPCPCCARRVVHQTKAARQVRQCYSIPEERDGEEDWAREQRSLIKQGASFTVRMELPHRINSKTSCREDASPEPTSVPRSIQRPASICIATPPDSEEEDEDEEVSPLTPDAYRRQMLSPTSGFSVEDARPQGENKENDGRGEETKEDHAKNASKDHVATESVSVRPCSTKSNTLAPASMSLTAETTRVECYPELVGFLKLIHLSTAYAASLAVHGVKELSHLMLLPTAELDEVMLNLLMDPGDEIILRKAVLELRPDPEAACMHQTPSGCDYYQYFDNESVCGWGTRSDAGFSDAWSDVGGCASLKAWSDGCSDAGGCASLRAWSDGCSDAGFELVSDVRSDDGSWVAIRDQRMVRTWSGNFSNNSWISSSA